MNWNTYPIIDKIAIKVVKEAKALDIELDFLNTYMDLSACDANGTPLDFEKLIAAEASDFFHDILGIRQNINRNNGKLENCFVPRCTK